MIEIAVNTMEYIVAGGNRHPAVADWDEKSGLVAYGADRNIALWYPQVCGTLSPLLKFKPFPNPALQVLSMA
jgi:hypothetical protein